MSELDYDFSGLTERQQEVLTFQGWVIENAPARSQPAIRTVKKLIERGLVIEHKRQWRGMTVLEYEVPLPVHMAWCQRCSDLEARRAA